MGFLVWGFEFHMGSRFFMAENIPVKHLLFGVNLRYEDRLSAAELPYWKF